jgi:hypothetical protein
MWFIPVFVTSSKGEMQSKALKISEKYYGGVQLKTLTQASVFRVIVCG